MLGIILLLSTGTLLKSLDHGCFMSKQSTGVYFCKLCDDVCECYGAKILNSRLMALEVKEIVDLYTEKDFRGRLVASIA